MKKLLVLLFLVLGSSLGHASDNPSNFNFDGVLMDGASPMSGPVAIKIQIFGGSESLPSTCLLFEETHSAVELDQGSFSIKVGSGVRNSNPVSGDSGSVTWKNLFANKPGVALRTGGAGTSCLSSYFPTTRDTRYLRVTVDNGSPITLSPDFKLSAVPFATTADTLQGLGPSDFVSTKASEMNFWNASKTNSITFQAPTNFESSFSYQWPSSPPAGGDILATDSSGNLSWTTPSSGGLSTSGGTMSGPIAMAGQNLSSTGDIQMSSEKTLSLGTFTNAQQSGISGIGKVWYNSDTNALMYRDGASIKSIGTVSSVAAGTGLIGGPITSSGVLAVDVGTTSGKIPVLNGSSQLGLALGSSALPPYSFGSDPNTGIFSPVADNIGFSTNGTERLRIDSTGKVQMFSTSDVKLDIGTTADSVSEVVVNASSSGRSAIIVHSDANVTFGMMANFSGSTYQGLPTGAVGLHTGNTAPLAFVLGMNEKMRLLEPSGNLGIGTTAPVVKLHVAGTDAIKVPTGTTAERPPGSAGLIRFNTSVTNLEFYNGTSWVGLPQPQTVQPVATSTYTIGSSNNSFIFTGPACTVTLPSATANTGRILYIRNTSNNVTSASTNVIPLGTTTAAAPILTGAAKFAMLQSDGVNWIIMMAN